MAFERAIWALSAHDRVHELITRKLPGHPAVERFQREAAAGEVSTLTREDVAQALEAATAQDPEFARKLNNALTIEGDIRATDSGVAIGGITGGTVYINPPAGDPGSTVAVVARVHTDHPEIFVGRDTECERLLAALAPEDGPVPVVISAVQGMGGVGKTALARHCAAEAVRRGWFPGGAFIVDLQGYTPGSEVPAKQVFAPLLRHLGADVPTTFDEQAAVYHRKLTEMDERVLIVLDNASSAAQVQGLLPSSPTHRAIVTTRDTLALPGTRLPLDVLPASDAVDLLHESLARIGDAAEELAQACGHLPLALRIAAGLLAEDPDLTVDELTEELTQSTVDAFSHGETKLSAVFTLSWNRLTAREPKAARLLRLLELNPGPDISTEAAAILADRPVTDTKPLLRTLRQAHLLQRVDSRWRLHDLVRRYLRTHPLTDADEATDRLLDHYTATAYAAGQDLVFGTGEPMSGRFASAMEGLAWLDAEQANLVNAIRAAATSGRHQHAVQLANALAPFMQRRNVTDWLSVAERGREAAAALDDPQLLADAWNNLGRALITANRCHDALFAIEQAISIYRETGNHIVEGMAWDNLGVALREMRRFDEAATAIRTGIEKLGNHPAAGIVQGNLGHVLNELEQTDDAIAAHEAAIRIFREAEDGPGEGMQWIILGMTCYKLNRLEQAAACYEEAITRLQGQGDRYIESMAWLGRGETFRMAGRFEDALAAFQVAIEIAQENGDHNVLGTAQLSMAVTLDDTGRPDDQRRRAAEAVASFEHAGDKSRAAEIREIYGLPDAG